MGDHIHGLLAHAGIGSRLWRREIESYRRFLQGGGSFTRKLVLKAKGLTYTSPAHRVGLAMPILAKD
jgi:hypothetical protein